MEAPKLYDAREAAARLRVHPVTLRKRVGDREWPATRIGRRLFWTDEQITAIIALGEQPVVERARRRRNVA